jgi:hypothetical protein
MHRPGGDDDDLSLARLDRLVVNGERSLPFLDDEGLLIGMVVKAGAGARRVVSQEERDTRPVVPTLESRRRLTAHKIAHRQHVRHL